LGGLFANFHKGKIQKLKLKKTKTSLLRRIAGKEQSKGKR